MAFGRPLKIASDRPGRVPKQTHSPGRQCACLPSSEPLRTPRSTRQCDNGPCKSDIYISSLKCDSCKCTFEPCAVTGSRGRDTPALGETGSSAY